MPRARTKQELIDFGETEYTKLMKLVDSFSPEQRTTLIVFDNRTIKDVLAHLHDWHELVFVWESESAAGGKPSMPAEGYTWKDLPALNEVLYQKSKGRDWKGILADFEQSHKKAMRYIANYSADELEVKAKVAWTGTTNLASYYAASTSSHYVWASDLLKKLRKSL